MECILNIIKKLCTREIIMYIIFGVLTTLVNIVSFFIFVNFAHLEENLSNAIAIVLAILFAYFTNSSFVFESNAKCFRTKFSQFIKFIFGRAFTMVIELVGFFILFNLIHIPDLISKIMITILVIILNYFISKFFAFKK